MDTDHPSSTLALAVRDAALAALTWRANRRCFAGTFGFLRIAMRRALSACSVIAVGTAVSAAQFTLPFTSPNGAPAAAGRLPAGAPQGFLSTAPQAARTNQSISLGWNEESKSFSVAIPNPSDSPLKILGVQAAGNLYVAEIPGMIAPRQQGSLEVIFFGSENEHGADLLRIRTSVGTREVLVAHSREKIIAGNDLGFHWFVGDAVTPKAINFSVDSAKLNGARLTGAHSDAGNTVTLREDTPNHFILQLTPSTTKFPHRIPVVLDFVPAIPAEGSMIEALVVQHPNVASPHQ